MRYFKYPCGEIKDSYDKKDESYVENNLAETHPELAKEWHPTKNGSLRPEDVTAGSGKKVWWLLSYDVPEDYPVEKLRGKHFDFEWDMLIVSRVNGYRCPFLSGKKVWEGFNDLATVNPELIEDWDYDKNVGLLPTKITYGSGIEVWWKCKICNYEWKSSINSRQYNGCPICGKRKQGESYVKGIIERHGSLFDNYPELVKEWHSTKNGNLKPENVTIGSPRKVWWKCKNGHEWESKIAERTKGKGCPYCNYSFEKSTSFPEQAIYYYVKLYYDDAINRDISFGFELDIYIPCINIAIEYDGTGWHQDVYKDLNKNEKCEEKGIRLIRIREYNCPDIDGEVLIRKDNSDEALEQVINELLELLSVNYEKADISNDRVNIINQYKFSLKENSLLVKNFKIASEWHPTKNGSLTPDKVTCSSELKVWWVCNKGHEFNTPISSRYYGTGCPICANIQKGIKLSKPKQGMSLAEVYPELIKEWHPTKNGDLTPWNVSINSSKRVWWLLPYDDPITGKHFDFEWSTIVSRRRGCPFLTGHAVWKGFNDLPTLYPELMKEWHPTRNELSQYEVTCHSGKKVWWKCSKCGYEWEAVINSRVNGNGCPICCYKDRIEYNSKSVICIETGVIYESISKAERKTGASMISSVLKGIQKTSGGYHWKYADDPNEVKFEDNKSMRKVQCVETGEIFESITLAERKTGTSHVSAVCNGR